MKAKSRLNLATTGELNQSSCMVRDFTSKNIEIKGRNANFKAVSMSQRPTVFRRFSKSDLMGLNKLATLWMLAHIMNA